MCIYDHLRLRLIAIPRKLHIKIPLVRWGRIGTPLHAAMQTWIYRPATNPSIYCARNRIVLCSGSEDVFHSLITSSGFQLGCAVIKTERGFPTQPMGKDDWC